MPWGEETTQSLQYIPMFVRRKRSRGRYAYWLVENRREHGFVVQHVIAYLGTDGACATLSGAIAWMEQRVAEIDREMEALRTNQLEATAEYKRLPGKAVALRDRLRRLRAIKA
jgi:hypothetical protein